ncbi:hypothetical protein FRB94_001852 [Tulasnella sp. JGI-2019a]|nr:hypothetical protein FRB94_001852 [Tulasnella sp. JGI-2019a]
MTEERPRKRAKAVHKPDTEAPAKVVVESRPPNKTLQPAEDKGDDTTSKPQTDAGESNVEGPNKAASDTSTPIAPFDLKTQRAKYTSEDYQGVLRLITYVIGSYPAMYDAKCLEEAADYMNRHKRDASAPRLKTDGDLEYREDGFPSLYNRPESEWDGGIDYSCEDAAKRDKEHVPWEELVNRTADVDESWFQCLISRSRPEDVKSVDIARIKLTQSDDGRIYEATPGEFWMWHVEMLEDEEVDKIRMVVGEIVGF